MEGRRKGAGQGSRNSLKPKSNVKRKQNQLAVGKADFLNRDLFFKFFITIKITQGQINSFQSK